MAECNTPWGDRRNSDDIIVEKAQKTTILIICQTQKKSETKDVSDLKWLYVVSTISQR